MTLFWIAFFKAIILEGLHQWKKRAKRRYLSEP